MRHRQRSNRSRRAAAKLHREVRATASSDHPRGAQEAAQAFSYCHRTRLRQLQLLRYRFWTERPCVGLHRYNCSRREWRRLSFVRGASLPDPNKVLLGSGKQARFVRLPSASVLDQSAVQALLAVAAERAQSSLPASGGGKLVIRSVFAKQRPRRKPPRKV